MKKVVFVIGNMDIGGTRTSLLNLLHFLKKSKDIQIDLIMLSHYGKLIKDIPSEINVIDEQFVISAALPGKSKNLTEKFYYLFVATFKKVFGYEKVYKYIFRKFSDTICKGKEYDAVFGYQEGICADCSVYIKAKKHYIWIHNDIDKWFDQKDYCKKTYEDADKIIFVAESAKNAFGMKFPNYKNKCTVIKNTIDVERIKQKSIVQGFDLESYGGTTLVSIGRVSYQKAFERIIPIAQSLINQDIAFRWYVIGDGELMETIRREINKNKLEDRVFLLGSMENPYPIMKQADLLVVTSYYESQPMVILESLILNVPVLTTRFSSSEEIIAGTNYGTICDNSIEGLEKELYLLLKNKSLIQNMKLDAQNYCYDNLKIVDQIGRLIR